MATSRATAGALLLLAALMMVASVQARDVTLSCKDNAFLKGKSLDTVKYAVPGYKDTTAIHAANAKKCMQLCVDNDACWAASYKETGWCFLLSNTGGNYIINKYPTADKACKLAASPVPTDAPTEEPTDAPTEEPTDAPTDAPTEEPTDAPTDAPTEEPTDAPTDAPTEEPTDAPTDAPTEEPTDAPTDAPTEEPTPAPTPDPLAPVCKKKAFLKGTKLQDIRLPGNSAAAHKANADKCMAKCEANPDCQGASYMTNSVCYLISDTGRFAFSRYKSAYLACKMPKA